MTTGTKLVFALFLGFICACEKVKTQEDGPSRGVEIGIDAQNVAFIDQFYQSDNGAISEPGPVDLDELIGQLENVQLIEKKTVSEIPSLFLSFIKSKKPNFSIANPGEDWQQGCISYVLVNQYGDTMQKALPTTQLVYFGLSEDIALMAFYTGGIGRSESVFIFKYNETEVIEYWEGSPHPFGKNKESILTSLKTRSEMNSRLVPDSKQRFYW